ncbi:hypothetical protein N9L26_00870 [Candidatus Pacebacteria bacterium]|nr:hypothetical protein [Candidatus Paceibacterota bacterium]
MSHIVIPRVPTPAEAEKMTKKDVEKYTRQRAVEVRFIMARDKAWKKFFIRLGQIEHIEE